MRQHAHIEIDFDSEHGPADEVCRLLECVLLSHSALHGATIVSRREELTPE